MSIPVFSSYIKRKDMDTVLSCLVTDSIGPGSYLERFQKNAKEYFAFEYGFFARGPMQGLELALGALGLARGDAVGLPALAPRWYAAVLGDMGISPIFADVSAETGSPGVQEFAASFGEDKPRIKALILSGSGGSIQDEGAYDELGIPVIEDITRSFGAQRVGQRRSYASTVSLLSLEDGSLLTSGGGALVFATNRRVATVLKNVSEGMLPESRMTDFNASLGLAKLRDLDRAIEKRRELRTLFLQAIAGKKHRTFLQPGDAEPGCWAFPVVLESSIKDASAYARKKEVETVVAFEHSCVSAGLVPEGACPISKSLSMRTLLFPLHQRIGNAGAQKISRVLASLP